MCVHVYMCNVVVLILQNLGCTYTVCMYTLGWVLLVPTNVSNFVSTYIAQLNVSNSSTMKIVYSPCTSSWVLLFILKNNIPYNQNIWRSF